MHKLARSMGLFLFCSTAVVSSLGAQDVYVTRPSNRIIKVDFETGKTRTVVRDRGTYFQGLAVRPASGSDELRLIVANMTHGGDIRVYNEATGAGARVAKLEAAHGVALSPQGDIFAVNRSYFYDDQVLFVDKVPGCDDVIHGPFEPGCGPGGYGDAVFIDKDVHVDGIWVKELTDVRQAKNNAPGLFSTEQLLVLVRKPAMVLAYTADAHDFGTCNGHCEPDVIVPPEALAGYTPTGFDIAGEALLITTHQGEILEVTASGVRGFFSLPGKGAKITVGADDGDLVAYATVPNRGGRVVQIDVATGAERKTVKKGIKVPQGVGTETSSVVVTAEGAGVEVLLDQLTTTFSEITSPGLTSNDCKFYDHPFAGDDCVDDNTCPSIPLSALDPSLPTDVMLPGYFQPFPLGSASATPKQVLICHVNTTAQFLDTIQNVHEEINSLGYEPDCETFDADPQHETRMAYAAEPDGSGSTFLDITVGCGNSHRGRGWKFSYVAPIVRNLNCTGENLKIQNDHLQSTFLDVASDITGPCPDPSMAPGPVPQQAFDDAGLGLKSGWSLLSDGRFGAGGNGLLLGGGEVTFEIKIAGFNHTFGTADADPSDPIVLFDTKDDLPGATAAIEPNEEPYLFFFETDGFAPAEKRVFSDGTGDSPLAMAVYRSVADPRRFALFFDDGGVLTPPEPDFNDFVVTATGMVEAQCNLALALADAQTAFDNFDTNDACNTSNIALVPLVDAMSEVTAVVDAQPDAFPDPMNLNTVGELKALAEGIIFQACKPLDGGLVVCPVKP